MAATPALRRLIFSSVLLPFWLVLISAVQATPPDNEPLRIGVTSGSPPYIYSIEDGRGLDPDILTAIVAKMGGKPEFVPVPYARLSLVLRTKKVDAVTFWTQPKDVTCYAGKPYRFWRNALFTVHRTDVAEDPTILSTGRLGIFMGSDHMAGQLSDVGIDYDSLQKISTINAAVRMMLYERLDGYIGDYPTVVYNFAKEDPDRQYKAEIRHFFPPMPQRLCFTETNQARAFDSALDALLRDTPDALSNITMAHGLTESITPPLE